MKDEQLNRLIENTFSKLACPAQRAGLYAEIEKAVVAAYNIGRENNNDVNNAASSFMGDKLIKKVA